MRNIILILNTVLVKFDSWKTEIAAAVIIFVWVIGSYFFFVAGIDGIHILFDGITGLCSSYGAVESDTFIPSSYVPNVYMQTEVTGKESVGEQSASKRGSISWKSIPRCEAYKENSRTFDSLFPVSAFRTFG